MALRILTNIPALKAINQLGRADASLNTALERLSTGLRINSAKDGAADLIIGKGLQTETSVLTRAIGNANDALSLLSITEGALKEIGNILVRMRELATISLNGINNPTTRSPLQAEFLALGSEISRIAGSVAFNNIKLLSPTAATAFPMSFQVGTGGDVNSRITYNGAQATLFALGLGNSNESQTEQVNGSTSEQGRQNAISAASAVDAAMEALAVTTGEVGAKSSQLSFSLNELQTRRENTASAAENILGADFAAEAANLVKAKILREAGAAVLAQANQSSALVLKLLA